MHEIIIKAQKLVRMLEIGKNDRNEQECSKWVRMPEIGNNAWNR